MPDGPDGIRHEYEEIERTEIGAAPDDNSPAAVDHTRAAEHPMRDFARDWAVHIITVVVIALTIACFVLASTVIDLTSEVKSVRTDLTEGQARSCVNLAQNSDYFPPSCLDPDVVAIYARDLIDSLETTGVQGANREALCGALEEQGVQDTDC